MLIEFRIGVNPAMFAEYSKGRTVEQIVEETNNELAAEAKKHFGMGKVTVGRLPDGRWFFQQLLLGRMIRVPDDLESIAARRLEKSLLAGVKILPVPGTPTVSEFHGLWAKQSFVDELISEERVTVNVPREQVAHVA